MKRRPTSLLLLVLVLASACRQVPVVELEPQGGDSLRERMIGANRLIAQSEESLIDAYIARRGWQMQRLDGGVRLEVLRQPSQGAPIMADDTVVVNYRVEALNGLTVYDRMCDTVVAGRLKPTRGFDLALRSLRRGSSARFILPSEQAYGVLGDGDRVGSRMVLVCQLSVE